MVITLTDEERRKFVLYLRQDADADKGMIETHRKLNMPAIISEMYEKKLKNEMFAKLVVAQLLDRTESMTIG